MRISSIQIFNIANNSMADANEAIIKTQEQLSSGQRVITPADDPVAATKIMQLNEELSSISQYRDNMNIAENNLVLEESALNGVNNLILRIQEIAVQAGNTATLSKSEYGTLAAEVDARLDELRNILNTQNANGDFIFGGYKSRTEPFTGDPGKGFKYNGDEGQQFIQIANGTTIAVSDSGKTAFVDIPSSAHTITTSASPSNTSNPPVEISVGNVTDRAIFDDFYPEDMVITFNAETNVTPAGKNFTATERSTGRIIVENQAYASGDEVEINGISFRMAGSPTSGIAPVPATRSFGADSATAAYDFALNGTESFTITVAGRTETFALTANINNTTELAAELNDTGNGNSAKLANLGISVDSNGFQMPKGIQIFIAGETDPSVTSVLGLNALSGSVSSDGELAQPGDRLFIDSTNKQDILTTMTRFSEAMSSFDSTQDSRDFMAETVAETLENLSSTQTSVLDVTSRLGARFNTVESTRALHLDSELVTSELLSELRDIDYAEAATRLSAQSLILQAAQASFLRVSQLSLFNQL